MGCCGRGNPIQRPSGIPPNRRNLNRKGTPRVRKNNCPSCGGNLQCNPNAILLGSQQVVKCKCTKCGRSLYRLR